MALVVPEVSDSIHALQSTISTTDYVSVQSANEQSATQQGGGHAKQPVPALTSVVPVNTPPLRELPSLILMALPRLDA